MQAVRRWYVHCCTHADRLAYVGPYLPAFSHRPSHHSLRLKLLLVPFPFLIQLLQSLPLNVILEVTASSTRQRSACHSRETHIKNEGNGPTIGKALHLTGGFLLAPKHEQAPHPAHATENASFKSRLSVAHMRHMHDLERN